MTTQKYHVKYNMPPIDNLIEGILLCGELYVFGSLLVFFSTY